jgi:hypothetical protein
MEPWNHYKEVVSLGKRLVEELGLADDVDTLGRWMAHYVAELIEKAETASGAEERSQAQRECMEVVLRLWDHRSSLPEGARPLASLRPALDVLNELRADRLELASNSNEGSPWSHFMREIVSTGQQCVSIILLAAAAEADLPREKKWLDDHGSMLSEEERGIIEALDGWLALQQRWDGNRAFSIAELAPEERSSKIFSALQSLLERELEALKRLKEQLRSALEE